MKKFLPDLIAILAFIILSFAYFFPAVIEDRALFQHDSVAGVGAGQEAKEFHERTGETTRWTNSLFGGMPTYQISPSYDSVKPLKWIENIYRLYLPPYVWLTFIMMLGFYILLRAFGLPAWLAGLGGAIWAFSSYFFILIAAGHIWKFITLAYIPPHDSRHCARISKEIFIRSHCHRSVHSFTNTIQPCTDVILLLICHLIYGRCFF